MSWARWPPSESQAPASINASITRLLQSRRSMRSHRSTSERYGPAAVRPAMIDSIALPPTFLIAPSPNRTRASPTTVNLNPDSFTSGGSTSRPSSRASAMYCTTLSVLPISDDSSADMNSGAQRVRFRQREPGEHVGDPHHLLLVGDDPVGRLEDLCERRVRVAYRLAAQLAVDEHEVHPGVERAGPEQRVRRHQVVEPVALHVA